MIPLAAVITVCGDPVTGVWCDRCALPSALAQLLLVGTRLMLIQQCLGCDVRRPIQ